MKMTFLSEYLTLFICPQPYKITFASFYFISNSHLPII